MRSHIVDFMVEYVLEQNEWNKLILCPHYEFYLFHKYTRIWVIQQEIYSLNFFSRLIFFFRSLLKNI